MGTFLLNDHMPICDHDSGADREFSYQIFLVYALDYHTLALDVQLRINWVVVDVIMAWIGDKGAKEKEITVEHEYHVEKARNDLPGLPPTRKVKFQIDLYPGAAPVVEPRQVPHPGELQFCLSKRKMALSECVSTTTCAKVKRVPKRSDLLVQHKISEWKWEKRNYGLRDKSMPQRQVGQDMIWVIVDTDSLNLLIFCLAKENDSMRSDRRSLKEVVSRHGVPVSSSSDAEWQVCVSFWHLFKKLLELKLDMSTRISPRNKM
ncbi:reverse transcriptase domain-containing protein [Tanacetum coccineum]